MNKSGLAILLLFISVKSMGQGGYVSSEDPHNPINGAINIVVSSVDNGEGNSYFAEAEKNERKGELEEAVTLYGKAAFEYNTTRQFARYGSALMRLSNVHLQLSHYTEAEQVVLNVALKNYSKIGSKAGQMESYSQLGRIYLASSKYTQSMWFYTQQGILAKQLGNNTSYIESVLGIANVKIRKKEYVMASRDVNRAELLARAASTSQFSNQIRDARALIAARASGKKPS